MALFVPLAGIIIGVTDLLFAFVRKDGKTATGLIKEWIDSKTKSLDIKKTWSDVKEKASHAWQKFKSFFGSKT